MSVTLIRGQVRPDQVAEVEAAAQKLFVAIKAARPDGVRYASTKLADDGATFVVLLELDGPANPLTAVPEFVEFQNDLKNRLAGPPTAEQLEVVGSYRLFTD